MLQEFQIRLSFQTFSLRRTGNQLINMQVKQDEVFYVMEANQFKIV